jgi:hypothetical protein
MVGLAHPQAGEYQAVGLRAPAKFIALACNGTAFAEAVKASAASLHCRLMGKALLSEDFALRQTGEWVGFLRWQETRGPKLFLYVSPACKSKHPHHCKELEAAARLTEERSQAVHPIALTWEAGERDATLAAQGPASCRWLVTHEEVQLFQESFRKKAFCRAAALCAVTTMTHFTEGLGVRSTL